MKKFFLFLNILCILFLFSCKKNHSEEFVQINATAEITRLQYENNKLKSENERLKSSTITENKLSGKIEYTYTLQQYDLTKAYILVFMDLFPASLKVDQYRYYYDTILGIEKEQSKEIIAEQQKTMTDFTGIWEIKNFLDSSGNETSKTFITTSTPLTGIYSDLSNDAEPFRVKFIITNKNEIHMQIFESSNELPIQGSTTAPIKYNIKFTDAKGTSTSFSAKNISDRISLGTTYSLKLHNALLQGGNIKFLLTTSRNNYQVKYEFEIPNAQFYNTASRIKGIL